MDIGHLVWVGHPIEGYKLGHLADLGDDSGMVCVELIDPKAQVCFSGYIRVDFIAVFCQTAIRGDSTLRTLEGSYSPGAES